MVQVGCCRSTGVLSNPVVPQLILSPVGIEVFLQTPADSPGPS